MYNKKESSKKYYLKNRRRLIEKCKLWQEKNREKANGYVRKYYFKHRNLCLFKDKIAREKLRKEILLHYGGKCACCGFSDLDFKIYNHSFLSIDHINGGGTKHMKKIKRGTLYKWIKRNKYPSGFRVLCMGCNVSMIPGENKCVLHKGEVI